MRDYLDLTEPPTTEMYGYAFTFSFSEEATFGYIMDGAECVIDAILAGEPTGRCDLFGKEQFGLSGRLFTIGVVLRLRRKEQTPDYQAWLEIQNRVAGAAEKFEGRITHQDDLSELAMCGSLQKTMVSCGAAELRQGEILRILGVAEDEAFFDEYINRQTEPT